LGSHRGWKFGLFYILFCLFSTG